MRVFCKSEVDKFELEIDGTKTIFDLMRRISGVINIKPQNFRLIFNGELCNSKATLNSFNAGRGKLKLNIEFNETESARKEVLAHIRKIGLAPKKINKSLVSLLEDFDREHKRNLKRPLNSAIKTETKGLKSMFKKKETAEEKKFRLVRERAKNIDSKLAKAYIKLPHFYLNQPLKQVPISICNHKLEVVLDTGAQNTIMTLKLARKVGVARQIDRKHAGSAGGLNSVVSVLGRISNLSVNIGTVKAKLNVYVLRELNYDFVLGLEVFKRLSAVLSFKDNCLIFPNKVKVAFLEDIVNF